MIGRPRVALAAYGAAVHGDSRCNRSRCRSEEAGCVGARRFVHDSPCTCNRGERSSTLNLGSGRVAALLLTMFLGGAVEAVTGFTSRCAGMFELRKVDFL